MQRGTHVSAYQMPSRYPGSVTLDPRSVLYPLAGPHPTMLPRSSGVFGHSRARRQAAFACFHNILSQSSHPPPQETCTKKPERCGGGRRRTAKLGRTSAVPSSTPRLLSGFFPRLLCAVPSRSSCLGPRHVLFSSLLLPYYSGCVNNNFFLSKIKKPDMPHTFRSAARPFLTKGLALSGQYPSCFKLSPSLTIVKVMPSPAAKAKSAITCKRRLKTPPSVNSLPCRHFNDLNASLKHRAVKIMSSEKGIIPLTNHPYNGIKPSFCSV